MLKIPSNETCVEFVLVWIAKQKEINHSPRTKWIKVFVVFVCEENIKDERG